MRENSCSIPEVSSGESILSSMEMVYDYYDEIGLLLRYRIIMLASHSLPLHISSHLQNQNW